MNNTHFMRYAQWKQTTYFLISILLIALTITHAWYSYKLYDTRKKIKATTINRVEKPKNNHQLAARIKEIDQQELYHLYNAFVEILPPHVKIEKIDYTKNSTTIILKARDNNGVVSLLKSCSKNSVLKKCNLKKSVQEKDGIVATLVRSH